jgi:hypothetical protein
MTRLVALFVLIVVFALLVPQASADFTKIPTFDLRPDCQYCDEAGVVDTIYTFHLENPDQSEDVVSVSIAIPIAYSIDPRFITNKTGITAMSGYASNPQLGTTQLNVVTTNTPGRFLISAMGTTLGEITIIEPSSTTPGKMEMKFSGVVAVMNHGCSAEIKTETGFFINPSRLADYVWAPSIANPTSGKSVIMEPRSGLSQVVTILPHGLHWRKSENTTSLATTETQSSTAMETVATTDAAVTTMVLVQTAVVQTTAQGVGFAIIGILAGVAAAVGGLVVVAARPRSQLYGFAGYYYCRKHRVPVWFINNQPWCPIERKYLGN